MRSAAHLAARLLRAVRLERVPGAHDLVHRGVCTPVRLVLGAFLRQQLARPAERASATAPAAAPGSACSAAPRARS